MDEKADFNNYSNGFRKGLMGRWFCIWKIVFNRKISPLYSPTSPSAGTLSAILKDNNE